ncbi:MAG: hypothetical protein JWO05_917 [Gemmatimonadetes bacterium]|nr:hypothetical protein [Gemmatimonadota bacterium]
MECFVWVSHMTHSWLEMRSVVGTPLITHITAGALGMITGMVALSSSKGAPLHRRAGMAFVYTMMVMAVLGGGLAVLHQKSPRVNLTAALTTIYFVATALVTVKPPRSSLRWLDVALPVMVSIVALSSLRFGIMAAQGPKGRLDGIPAFPFFLFGVVGLIGVFGDVQMLRAGGVLALKGAPRIARHLWRMCFPLALASLSFFAQVHVLPKAIRIPSLLILPVPITLVAMFYWLWRVRYRRAWKNMTLAEA